MSFQAFEGKLKVSWLVCNVLPPYQKKKSKPHHLFFQQSFALLWFLKVTALIRSTSVQSSSSTAISNGFFSPRKLYLGIVSPLFLCGFLFICFYYYCIQNMSYLGGFLPVSPHFASVCCCHFFRLK